MSNFSLENKKDISIVLCGAAGQGINTVETFLTDVLQSNGFNIAATKEYMSRVRGGTNSTELRVSTKRVAAYLDRIDIFIPLDGSAIPRQQKRISKETIIIGESEFIRDAIDVKQFKVIEIPWTKYAIELGNKVYSNIIAAGVISKLFQIDIEKAKKYLEEKFSTKGEKIIQENIKAFLKGCEIAQQLINEKGLKINLKIEAKTAKENIYSGANAIGLGAIAGGCNFICSYPMSPSTGVLLFLAKYGEEFDILVEQAEDEIAAINAGLGAAYAGARAMASTSGGGFALMTEGVSLCGIIETPIVIHVAQRPGPATGLPTRTAQEDLELVLYSGHGEFPRIILTPGTIEEGILLTQQAFNFAAKFQIPVFILTDQFFMDLYYNFPSPDLSKLLIDDYIVESAHDYKRFKYTENGISPRAIPGFGKGLVRVDSDEHDEDGFITEDLENTRVKMVEKRLKKDQEILKEVIPPQLLGAENFSNLIIGWGSTFTAIREALEVLGRDDVAFLHFKQVYPLHPKTKDYLNKAKKVIIIENNATAQFSKLIKLVTGFEIHDKILKYSGMPFSVEEIAEKIKQLLKK